MRKRIDFDGAAKDGSVPVYFEYDSTDGELREGQNGVGEIAYHDGSVYRGTLVYRNGKLNKYGYGEQDFSGADICFTNDCGAPRGNRLYKFVGVFDYTVNDWICGNGVMYFKDADGRPSCYATGRFSGTTKRGEYSGIFPRELLLPEYESLPQIDLTPFSAQFAAMSKKASAVKSCKSVMIGDSWFEFYERGSTSCPAGTFAADTKGKDVVDLAVGGTTYGEWIKNSDDVLSGIIFEQIFVNLGYNDIHCGASEGEVMSGLKTLTGKIRERSPVAHIYVNAVCPSPVFVKDQATKTKLNKAVAEYCSLERGMTFVDCDKPFLKDASDKNALSKVFAADGIHLNEQGYALWACRFAKYF